MKKYILLLLLTLTIVKLSKAQNYQCLQRGVVHRFTNDVGYMRGIRIDSTSVNSSGDTVFHPFRTVRTGRMTGVGSDTLGGSWLCKHVIKKANGTFLFDNGWGDTVIINTQAGLGSSWVFYNDTSANYYTATVVSLDTMTVLGSLDSIKKINLSSFIGGSFNPSDSMNNFQLILSKDHGFVQVFDLFTFPYHFPGSSSTYYVGIDRYLDEVGPYFSQGSYSSKGAGFRLTNYVRPRKSDIYNFNSGDAFCGDLNAHSAATGIVKTEYYDSVVSKTIIDPWHTQYSLYNVTRYNSIFISSGYPVFNSWTNYNTYLWNVDSSFLLPFDDKIPEERGFLYSIYYLPNDTSMGMPGPLYKTRYAIIFFESCDSIHWYKAGLMDPRYDSCAYFMPEGYWLPYNYYLNYFNKGTSSYGSSCRTTLAVQETPNMTNEAVIAPNPAYSVIRITFLNNSTRTLTLSNALGQVVYSHTSDEQEVLIDVNHLPNGMYITSIVDENGKRDTKKVVVAN